MSPSHLPDEDGNILGWVAFSRSLGRVEEKVEALDERFNQANEQRTDLGEKQAKFGRETQDSLATIGTRLDAADKVQVQLIDGQRELTGRVAKLEKPFKSALEQKKIREDMVRQVSIYGFAAAAIAWGIVEPIARWMLQGAVTRWFGWG